MRVTRLSVRDFRSYTTADVQLGPGMTIVHGHNGAGKTNLLEALYFGCTGRSCRTSNEREIVRFGATSTRVEVDASSDSGEHHLSVGFAPGEPKRMCADGADVDRLIDVQARPQASVFLPERLELVKGPPALRRSHLDALIAALWPARVANRRAYSQALAQRNALLARVRGGAASRDSLGTWEAELARHGIALRDDRAAVIELVTESFRARALALGLNGETQLHYRPRTRATSADQLADELAQRRTTDLERGFTGHGPHRDDLVLTRDGRDLRAYGSQGEQRLALLSLLLAEREAIAAVRDRPPLMLLDDVMSELDPQRRERLSESLCEGGQSLITTTDLLHVPGGDAPSVTRLHVSDSTIHQEALAA